MTDDIQPEIGDIVEWGEELRDKHGHVISGRPRGTIEHVFKNGSVKIVSDGGSVQKLKPSEYTILSKGG